MCFLYPYFVAVLHVLVRLLFSHWMFSNKITSLRGCLLCCILGLGALQATPPNIVLIFADDLGYGDLGCYGAKYPTPALDTMAAEGFRSTDMISAANVCTPSRAALLTGRYPSRAGLPTYRNPTKTEHDGLHPDEITIAELLKTAGYRSMAVGKWHRL